MTKVLNINLYDLGLGNAVKEIILKCQNIERLNLCISATGAHGLIVAYNDENFKKVLDYFFISLPDGMPGVWVGRLKGAENMSRCYGPDFFRDIMIESSKKNIKHFFCGGKEGVAEQLKIECARKFRNNNVVGTFSPPFREMSDEELNILAQTINNLDVDIVWIGLSTPKQEIFAYRLSKYTNVKFICTVGAAFDFHTGNVPQAPKFIQKIGMEWFFRLLMEPKRLYKRYIEIVPKFIIYNLIELLQYYISKITRRIKNV